MNWRAMNPSTQGWPDSATVSARAVVADVRLGHHHDLAAVGGVGEDLLVAGHRGVEHHLAEAGARGRPPRPSKTRAVFEDEQAGRGGQVHRKGGGAGVLRPGTGASILPCSI